jgi:hypothetical protein
MAKRYALVLKNSKDLKSRNELKSFLLFYTLLGIGKMAWNGRIEPQGNPKLYKGTARVRFGNSKRHRIKETHHSRWVSTYGL